MAYDLRKATGRRERTSLLVALVVVHRDHFHGDVDGARLPVDGGRLRFRRDGFQGRGRGGVRADLCGASNSEKKPPPASCDGHKLMA